MAKKTDFNRELESLAVLDELLALSEAQADSDGVIEYFRAAQQAGAPPAEAIPGLFDKEPRFADPEVARRLYQNLLGLWDLVASGKDVSRGSLPTKPRREKPPPPATPPPYFDDNEPDEAFVEAAWKYLQDDERTRTRLLDAFENRQDALLQYLDEQGFTEAAYASARYLLFELFAFIELGWPAGVRAVAVPFQAGETRSVPEALSAYLDEALQEAALDEEQPLTGPEAEKVRAFVEGGVRALWDARKASSR